MTDQLDLFASLGPDPSADEGQSAAPLTPASSGPSSQLLELPGTEWEDLFPKPEAA